MKLLSVFFTGWGSLVIEGENFLKIAFGSERVGSAGEPILFTCNSKPMLRLKFWNYDLLRVGLIRQPLCIMYIPSSKRSQMGLYPQTSYFTTSSLFPGESLIIITSITLDRFLVVTLRLSLQTICDYEANTNISRHFMAFTRGFRNGLSLFSFYDTCYLRNFIVVYSNLNFVPLENVCTLSSPGYSTTPLSPRTEQRGVNLLYVMWRRNKVISATSIHTYITLFSKAGQEYATYKLMWT